MRLIERTCVSNLKARVLQAVVNSLIVRVQEAARAARQVERAAEWEQKAAEAALAKAVREMERACGAGAKRRRYTCGKCRDAGLPAEGHMASQAVCPR